MTGVSTGRRWNRRRGLMAAAVAAAICAGSSLAGSAPARAEAPDPDMAALRGYALSLDKVEHYAAASKTLRKDVETKPDVAGDVQSMQHEPQATLADINAMMGRHPKVYAYFQREGLSLRDTVMLPLALRAAMLAVESPTPEQFAGAVNPEQIAFARQHKQELEKLFGDGGASGH